jgi:hypothetical protein
MIWRDATGPPIRTKFLGSRKFFKVKRGDCGVATLQAGSERTCAPKFLVKKISERYFIGSRIASA